MRYTFFENCKHQLSWCTVDRINVHTLSFPSSSIHHPRPLSAYVRLTWQLDVMGHFISGNFNIICLHEFISFRVAWKKLCSLLSQHKLHMCYVIIHFCNIQHIPGDWMKSFRGNQQVLGSQFTCKKLSLSALALTHPKHLIIEMLTVMLYSLNAKRENNQSTVDWSPLNFSKCRLIMMHFISRTSYLEKYLKSVLSI